MIFATNMKSKIHKKIVYRISTTVKKNITHKARVMTVLNTICRVNGVRLILRRILATSTKGILINSGEMFPKLCGEFKNVTLKG